MNHLKRKKTFFSCQTEGLKGRATVSDSEHQFAPHTHTQTHKHFHLNVLLTSQKKKKKRATCVPPKNVSVCMKEHKVLLQRPLLSVAL